MEFRFVYTGLRVRDIERSLQFYTEILGMEVVDPLESYEPTRGKAVTVRSPSSSQLLELNWYEEGSQFGGGLLASRRNVWEEVRRPASRALHGQCTVDFLLRTYRARRAICRSVSDQSSLLARDQEGGTASSIASVIASFASLIICFARSSSLR